jgi:hypothetical protein
MKETFWLTAIVFVSILVSRTQKYVITTGDGNLLIGGKICCRYCYHPLPNGVETSPRCLHCNRPIPNFHFSEEKPDWSLFVE